MLSQVLKVNNTLCQLNISCKIGKKKTLDKQDARACYVPEIHSETVLIACFELVHWQSFTHFDTKQMNRE